MSHFSNVVRAFCEVNWDLDSTLVCAACLCVLSYLWLQRSALGLYGKRFDLSEKAYTPGVYAHVITRVVPWEWEDEIEMYSRCAVEEKQMYSNKHIFTAAEVVSEKERKESFFILVFATWKPRLKWSSWSSGKLREWLSHCSAVWRRIICFLEHTADIGNCLTRLAIWDGRVYIFG